MVGATLGAAAVAGLGYAFFGTGPLRVVATLQGIQAEGGEHTIAGYLIGFAGMPGLAGPVGLALAVSLAANVAWLLRRGLDRQAGLDRRRRLGDGRAAVHHRLPRPLVRRLADPAGRAEQ